MEEALIKKVLPHNTEAEQSVVSSMIMLKEAIVIASEIISAEDFYSKECGLIFASIMELYHEGIPVDVVMVQERLRSKGAPPEIVSLDFMIAFIGADVHTSRNVEHYARIVSEKALLRRLIRVVENISNICYLGGKPLDEILEMAEKDIFQVLSRKKSSDYEPIKEIVIRALETIENASRNRKAVTGLSTGFIDLDYKTSGFQPSDLILVAARPSMGKTAFVLNIAQHVVFRQQHAAAIFSLEMSKEQLVNRLFSLESKVNSQSIRTGDLNDVEWEKLIEGAGVIGNSRLIIDDTPGIGIGELRTKCRKYKVEFDLQLVIIDYLQLMSGRGGRKDSRQQEISDISRALKALARELNVPIVALSQLNRTVEQRPDHRPMLSDLRESGAIEQDADVVMFLYREDYYDKDTENKNVAEVIIAKQRNGPIGTVQLVWLPDYTKFVNMEK